MADIIDFRTRSKSHYRAKIANNGCEPIGQIILFSGVRIEREESENIEIQLTKTQLTEAQLNELHEFLSSKTS